jgi:hypothetical protein
MRDRSLFALLLIGVVIPLTSCVASPSLTSIAVSPTTMNFGGSGLTTQLTAIGSYTRPNHAAVTRDITNQVTWASSTTDCVTVSNTGLITSGPNVCSNILVTASAQGFHGIIQGTMTVNVTQPSGGGGGSGAEPLLSIAVVPGSITTDNLLGTGQFLAYGTFSTPPFVQDITNGINHNGYVAKVNWISDAPYIFPVDSAGAPGTTGSTGGLVTAVGSGNANIYATAANPDGTVVYSSSVTFNCPYAPYNPGNPTATPPVQPTLGTCNDHTIASGLLVTLTIFNAGLNTSNWLITAPSATGTPNVINCGPGAAPATSVCTASYPLGTTVTVTAPARQGVQFGGWSWNCTPVTAVTAAGPNACTVTLGNDPNTSNDTVGAIFN